MEVRFSELANAGLRNLFTESWRRVSVEKQLALMLRSEPTRNAVPLRSPELDGFWVRPFFAGLEIRVLFELEAEVTVWSVARATSDRAPTK
jgi:hypothetical protein